MEIPYLRAYIAGQILDFPAMFDYQYGYGSNIEFFHPDIWNPYKVVPPFTIAFSWGSHNSNNYGFCWWYIYS